MFPAGFSLSIFKQGGLNLEAIMSKENDGKTNPSSSYFTFVDFSGKPIQKLIERDMVRRSSFQERFGMGTALLSFARKTYPSPARDQCLDTFDPLFAWNILERYGPYPHQYGLPYYSRNGV